jgi:tetratricopeptide (TPR) repeat protein
MAFSALLAVGGCQTLGIGKTTSAFSSDPTLSAEGDAPNKGNQVQLLVREAFNALERRDLKLASHAANLALKLDITNPHLQLLNGYVYHQLGDDGDSAKYSMAEQGYRQALKFDSGNLAAHYQLGLLYKSQRRYQEAQAHFSYVAIYRSGSPDVLYNLAVASYFAHDAKTADAALSRLAKITPDANTSPEILKARMMALAAMDDRAGVDSLMAQYALVAPDRSDLSFVRRRVDNWRSFYESDAKVILAQGGYDPYAGGGTTYQSNPYGDSYGDGSSDAYDVYGDAPVDTYGDEVVSSPDDASMVVVDVVLIGTQEDMRDSRGVNLLNGLQLQFGNPLTGAPAAGITRSKTRDFLGTGLEESTKTITSQISIPAVTYSLNIANSLNSDNQILAKPSLVAQTGKTSEFFSGTEILAAAVSGGNGDSVSVQKEVGVKLAVTPQVLANDEIRLHVVAERTFLTDPSNSVVFEFRLDTTKTNVNSTVTMKFGETLILGGLSERETSNVSDGVPLLKDIPILSYLFSEKTERNFEKSILILLTPRRPHYVRQSAEDRKHTGEDFSPLEPEVSRLERRHSDWFTPRPTFESILDKLQGKAFFDEFRTGDMEISASFEDTSVEENLTALRKYLLTES